jgi:hypothetical protein
MRQGEINKGFDVLRERIPHPVLSKGKCEKLRKIDILHVAISYIRALENILESGEAGINEFANSLYSVVSPSCSLAMQEAKVMEVEPSSPASPASLPTSEEGSSRSVSYSPEKPAFFKMEPDDFPAAAAAGAAHHHMEKRRQKVLFQNRALCQTG